MRRGGVGCVPNGAPLNHLFHVPGLSATNKPFNDSKTSSQNVIVLGRFSITILLILKIE
jgi:hypothetical protein